MQPNQKSLYYITGGPEALLRNSPLLEVYKKKDIEVLILDDDIDEIVFSSVDKYGETDLKAVNKGAASDDLKSEAEPEKAESLKPLLEKFKATLGDRRQRRSHLDAPRRQPLRHRLRRRRALCSHAPDDAGHGPEKPSRAETHARDQPRSRDHQKARRQV